MSVSKLLLGVLFLVALGYAVPAYAPPKCDGVNDPPACNKDNGDSGGNTPQIIGVHEDLTPPDEPTTAPLWAPTDADPDCVLTKNSGNGLSGAFPRHDPCAILITTGDALGDDIIIVVDANNRGEVVNVQVQGQDKIGLDGTVYITDLMTPIRTDTNSDGNMVMHVHADNVNIYKCDTHVLKKKSICDTPSGIFALDDQVYSEGT